MVRVAIAGGSGELAREVIDALLVTGKHDITVLARKDPSIDTAIPAVSWRVVDYSNQTDLVDALRGIHTLLSFVQTLSDPGNQTQESLVNAAITAGVKRFAPSEFGSAGTIDMPWNAGKASFRQYLRKINEKNKVLEYTLFQPGLLLDYLGFPHQTTRHITPLSTQFDLEKCRVIVVDGQEDAVMTLTTVADVAAIVTRAVEYEGEWPERGGISGNSITYSQIIEIGQKIRGRSFEITKVKLEDLEAGVLGSAWGLRKRHHSVSEEESSEFMKMALIGLLVSSTQGAWHSSDEFNQLFPDYKFDDIATFLGKIWDEKS